LSQIALEYNYIGHTHPDYDAKRCRTPEGGATHASRGWQWIVTLGLRAAGIAHCNALSESDG
jgi:hypothetical protein